MTRLLTLLVAAAALAFPGCSSPTEPDTSYVLAVAGSPPATFATANGKPSLLELHVVLDGEDVSTGNFKFATPVASVRFTGAKFGARRGHHVLSLRVTTDSASPVPCAATGVRMLLQTPEGFSFKTIASVDLPDRSASLGSGDALVYEFDI